MKLVDESLWQSHRETVSPFRYVHDILIDIL